MENNHPTNGQSKWMRCTGCGCKIRKLGGPHSLTSLNYKLSVRRRGFQCANCGQVNCFSCSTHGCRCTCRSNAWVAMPYLDNTERLPPRMTNT